MFGIIREWIKKRVKKICESKNRNVTIFTIIYIITIAITAYSMDVSPTALAEGKKYRPYCATVEDTHITQIVLNPDTSYAMKVVAIVYDFHYRTAVFAPEEIPKLYFIFISILLFTMFLTVTLVMSNIRLILELYSKYRLGRDQKEAAKLQRIIAEATRNGKQKRDGGSNEQ